MVGAPHRINAVTSAPSFAVRASWTPNRGYLGWLLDLDRIGSRSGASFGRGLQLGPRAGDGWAKASWNVFVWICDKFNLVTSNDWQAAVDLVGGFAIAD